MLSICFRVFARSAVDAMRAIVLFVVGSMVSVYAIAQNTFSHRVTVHGSDAGRPNALLSELDWLGDIL